MNRADSPTRKLHEIRAEIDALNREILSCLERRAELVDAVADVKDELALEAHDPRREEEMLRRLVRDAQGPLAESDVRAIFAAIFRVGVDQQLRRRSAPGRSTGDAS